MGTVEVDVSQLRAAAARLQSIGPRLTEKTAEVSRKLEPQWKQLLSSKASTTPERRMIAATGRATVIEGGLRLEAGKGARLSGGLRDAGPIEYGANRGKKKTYKRRSKRGGSHPVTRRTAAQFRPFNKTGYVFAPAVKVFVPKLREGWFEGLKVVVSDSIEGGVNV